MDEENLVQGSKKWLEWRKNKITGTKACIIMNGVHFDETPLSLYNEMISDEIKEKPVTHAMKEGKRKEPLALAKFEEETGYLMNQPMRVHNTLKWMGCSLDGLEIEGSYALEIKSPLNPDGEDHQLALRKIVPPKYFPQIQHTLEVCQLDEMYYMSYISDSDYTIFKVKKDHEYTARLLQAESEFWQRVQDRNPPEPTDRDCTEITSESWANLSNQYAAVHEVEKEYKLKLEQCEQIKNNIKDALIALADNRSVHGEGIKLSKCVRRGHIDYAKIPILQGMDLEPFRKESTEFWKVSFQGDKDE